MSALSTASSRSLVSDTPLTLATSAASGRADPPVACDTMACCPATADTAVNTRRRKVSTFTSVYRQRGAGRARRRSCAVSVPPFSSELLDVAGQAQRTARVRAAQEIAQRVVVRVMAARAFHGRVRRRGAEDGYRIRGADRDLRAGDYLGHELGRCGRTGRFVGDRDRMIVAKVDAEERQAAAHDVARAAGGRRVNRFRRALPRETDGGAERDAVDVGQHVHRNRPVVAAQTGARAAVRQLRRRRRHVARRARVELVCGARGPAAIPQCDRVGPAVRRVAEDAGLSVNGGIRVPNGRTVAEIVRPAGDHAGVLGRGGGAHCQQTGHYEDWQLYKRQLHEILLQPIAQRRTPPRCRACVPLLGLNGATGVPTGTWRSTIVRVVSLRSTAGTRRPSELHTEARVDTCDHRGPERTYWNT